MKFFIMSGIIDSGFILPRGFRFQIGITDISWSLIYIQICKRRNTLATAHTYRRFPIGMKQISHIRSGIPLKTIITVIIPVSSGIDQKFFKESCFVFRKPTRSEEHTSELQSRPHLVCRLLLEKKKK